MSTSSTDLYALLEVERTASGDEIRKSYRRLARLHHPDVSSAPDAEQRFKEISLAYEVLSDPQKRQQYDAYGTTAGAAGGGYDGSPFGGFGSLNDIFEMFFGGGGFGGGQTARRPRNYIPGDDLERSVHLTLKDCLADKPTELQLERRETCGECAGSGAEPGTQAAGCETCGGQGIVQQVRDTLLGRIATTITCPRCRGEGRVVTTPCRACAGQGLKVQRRKIEFVIPAGVDDGNVMRVSGQGHHGRGGAPAGDVLVHISVEPDKRFERRGADLYHVMRVPFPDLALGATVDVPTPVEPEKLRIPAGTDSHATFVLRGHGMPRLRGSGRGNLTVQVMLETPRKLTKRQRELLEELRATDSPGGGLFGLGRKRRKPAAEPEA